MDDLKELFTEAIAASDLMDAKAIEYAEAEEAFTDALNAVIEAAVLILDETE